MNLNNNLNLINIRNPLDDYTYSFKYKFIQNYTLFLFSSFGVVITLSIILMILKLKF